MNFDCDFIGKDSQFKIANNYGKSNILLRYGNNCCASVNVPNGGSCGGGIGSLISGLCFSKTTLFALAILICYYLYSSGCITQYFDISSIFGSSTPCNSGCSSDTSSSSCDDSSTATYSLFAFDLCEENIKSLFLCGLVIAILLFFC